MIKRKKKMQLLPPGDYYLPHVYRPVELKDDSSVLSCYDGLKIKTALVSAGYSGSIWFLSIAA